MLNKDGYRYLQDYGLGPAEPTPRNKAMELGPRDRLSQAYWHEKQKGRTVKGPHGDVVHLDLRHLGEKKLRERLPQIYELAVEYLGVDPAKEPIPVLPAVHYTMGGIAADGTHRVAAARPVLGGRVLQRRHPWRQPPGLEFADRTAGVRQGRRRGSGRAMRKGLPHANAAAIGKLAEAAPPRALGHRRAQRRHRAHRHAARARWRKSMEDGCGIYRTAADHAGDLRQARGTEAALPEGAGSTTTRRAGTPNGCWRSSWVTCWTWPQAMAHSALNRARIARLAPAAGRLRGARRRRTSSSTRWRTYRGDGRAAHRLRRRSRSRPRSPAPALTAPPAKRPTARPRRPLMPDSQRIEIQVLRYRPEQEDKPVLAELLRAVHRRHVGAAGAAVHQGRPRRHAELPLVVPHGDLRQLRDDGQRQAQAVAARPSCATCCPGRCASRRWRISRSSATWW